MNDLTRNIFHDNPKKRSEVVADYNSLCVSTPPPGPRGRGKRSSTEDATIKVEAALSGKINSAHLSYRTQLLDWL